MKKVAIILIVLIISLFVYKSFFSPTKTKGVSDQDAQLTLFWGDGCPHCKLVEDYITANQVESKVKIAYKEVYYNKSNQTLLQDTVKKCPEIDTSQGVGVPLAFVKNANKCLYGDTPIIDWLKSMMLK